MHELAITQSIVEAVLDHTAGRQVSTVRLKIGRLSGVVPSALTFCFELVSAGTPLEGADLEIDEPPGLAHCQTCGLDFAIPDLCLWCECGSTDVELRTGRELLVSSVEVV